MAVVKGVFTVYSAAPELVYRLLSVGSANELILHAGPLFEIWSVEDEDSQPRVGIQGAVSFDVPLGDRFAGSLTAGAAVMPSPFAAEQLASGFERRALWRRRVAVGLAYRL